MSQSLAPPMPTHGERGAPQFDPTKLHGLRHFFNDLNFQFVQSQVVDEAEMKGHALSFVNCDTMELWEILLKFANVTALYPKFVDAVCQLYPSSDVEQHWLIADMDNLVGDTSRTGILSLADLGKYYRDFIAITTFLIVKNCAFDQGAAGEKKLTLGLDRWGGGPVKIFKQKIKYMRCKKIYQPPKCS